MVYAPNLCRESRICMYMYIICIYIYIYIYIYTSSWCMPNTACYFQCTRSLRENGNPKCQHPRDSNSHQGKYKVRTRFLSDSARALQFLI